MGGPPLVAPHRVNFGGSDRNEEGEIRNTWFAVIAPRPVLYSHKDCIKEFNTFAGPVQFVQLGNWLYL